MVPSLDFILNVKGSHLRWLDLIYININIPAFVYLYDYYFLLLLSSLQLLLFSCSVVSDWGHHGLQHARLPCPSPSPGAWAESCPLSQWCHPAISSSVIPFSVIPFSSCLQSFPASGSFLMSWLFASGCQSIGVSASASVPLMNIQGWFPLGLTSLILQCKGLSRVFSNTQFKSSNSSALSLLYGPTLTPIHDYWKNHSLH